MSDINNYIKDKYGFLIEQGFVINEIINNGNLYSVAFLKNPKWELIFCFTTEKGALSISVSSQKILNEEVYDKYSKYYELFYIVKLLEPEIQFSNINSSIYPIILQDKLETIKNLFTDESVDQTIKKLNVVIKQYNKIRWKQ